MAIKENIDYIKEELNSQEQLLENAIRGERFIKRHKNVIIGVCALALVALVGYGANEYIKDSKRASANAAYEKLLANPSDEASKNALKKSAPSLFALFAIKQNAENNNSNLIDEALALQIDPLLKEILQNTKSASGTGLMSDYNALKAGYAALKTGNVGQAKIEFAKVSQNQNMQSIVKSIEHYQGK